MSKIKIQNTLYQAQILGRMKDSTWDDRESKSITISMDYGTAKELFVDNIIWSILDDDNTEYDNSDFCLAGDITDHRDGTITVKMGKKNPAELLEDQLIAAENAMTQGVNSIDQ